MSWIEDIIVRYWWIFTIIIVAILLFVWSRLDSYTKIKIKRIFSGRTLMVIAIVVGWYIWNKTGASHTIKYSDQWMPIIILLILCGANLVGTLRYYTQQFLSPNFQGSYSKPPYRLNGYLIYAIDSFDAGGLSWPYATRIAIVREEPTELLDAGSISIAKFTQVSKYELPEEIFQFISNHKYFKKATSRVFYGWFDDIERVDWEFQKLKDLAEKKNDPKHIYSLLKKELAVDNPKVSTLYWLYRNQSKGLNKQTESYDSVVESVEKGVEHHKRVKDAYIDKRDRPPQRAEGYEEQY